MEYYDLVLIHPPSVTYFRSRPFLPGPLHRTVPIYTPLFIMFPIGMVSIASYLEERGMKVKVINLAEKLLVEKTFDLKSFLKGVKSKVYGIGLHWVVHAQGAIEVARLCKSLHPDSIVVLGGLTATCFAEQIVREFSFIDCVVRGEGEQPLHRLLVNLDKYGKFEAFKKTSNLTFKTADGGVSSTISCRVVSDLDSLNFTRLDLVEPRARTLTSPTTGALLWNLPFCRGCTMNCATCGGSKYAYSKIMNRRRIAPRSPEKLYEDFAILDEMGIRSIFLFQDPRICGEEYVNRFLKVFKNARWSNIRNVGIELFYPASMSYLEKLKRSRIAENIGLSISPESASDYVRNRHGRHYTNTELLRTIRHASELQIPIAVFFMLTLGMETKESLKEMSSLWKKLLLLNPPSSRRRISVDFGPMLLLDPGSMAFDSPDKYGYKLRFKRFKDHYDAMNIPHWSFWISYETMSFTRPELARIILDMWESLVKIKWELGMMGREEKDLELFLVSFERAALQDVENAKTLREIEEVAAEIVEISKDKILSQSYVLTHDLEDRIIS